jgi:predicted aminopeptidase
VGRGAEAGAFRAVMSRLRRTAWRWFRRALGVVTVIVAVVLTLTPMGCYISRAAYEEAKILSRRQPIPKLIRDSATDPVTRAKLQLVLDARQFAVDSLGLKAKESFTTYSKLDRDTLVLVVSATYRDRLERKTWWFPIVGSFPYKGFFDFEQAKKTAAQLEKEGFVVTIGPSAAFSTLGWFNDPLVTTTLRMDSVSLANTVIHELLHNTFFAKGTVTFNESFASFVGGRGAEHFFRAKGDSLKAKRAADDWHDDIVLGAFWARLVVEIDSVFGSLPLDSTARRIAGADTVYARARKRLVDSVGPQLRTYPASWPTRVLLNNAVVMSRRVYAEDLEKFDSVYFAAGRDLKLAIQRVIAAQRAKADSVRK